MQVGKYGVKTVDARVRETCAMWYATFAGFVDHKVYLDYDCLGEE
jgi:hypothetical protein